jgi:hypothetical protein
MEMTDASHGVKVRKSLFELFVLITPRSNSLSATRDAACVDRVV